MHGYSKGGELNHKNQAHWFRNDAALRSSADQLASANQLEACGDKGRIMLPQRHGREQGESMLPISRNLIQIQEQRQSLPDFRQRVQLKGDQLQPKSNRESHPIPYQRKREELDTARAHSWRAVTPVHLCARVLS